jgi:hypothetical protein
MIEGGEDVSLCKKNAFLSGEDIGNANQLHLYYGQ